MRERICTRQAREKRKTKEVEAILYGEGISHSPCRFRRTPQEETQKECESECEHDGLLAVCHWDWVVLL